MLDPPWATTRSGEMFDSSGTLLDTGYAGKGAAKNDPGKQCVADAGPIPRGSCDIGDGQDHPKLGPLALPLSPDAGNDMCGRTGFFTHGDSVSDPGDASDGCIILKKATRQKIDDSNDRRLRVVRASTLSARHRDRETLRPRRKARSRK